MSTTEQTPVPPPQREAGEKPEDCDVQHMKNDPRESDPMHSSAAMDASTSADTTARSIDAGRTLELIEMQRVSHWSVRQLWQIAGFDDREQRVQRFVVLLFRPPLVTSSSPRVAAEVLVPARSAFGAVAMMTSAVAIMLAGGLVTTLVPWFIVPGVLIATTLPSVLLMERALLTWSVPKDHVRLQDVVAESRGSGMGEASLSELLGRVSRPVVLSTTTTAPGVIAMYERFGFTCVKGETSTMTRPARPVEVWPNENGVERLSRWLWPSLRDALPGVIVAAALVALYAAEEWSRQIVVAVIAVVAVTAARTDWRIQRIPNVISGSGFVALAALAIATGEFPNAIAGAALMAGPLLASHLATRGRTPGLGDVKLAASTGAGLGVLTTTASFTALLLALFGGGIFGMLYQRRHGSQGFPLGPAIATSTLIVAVAFGARLRGWV